MLTSKQRAYLRSIAHRLPATEQIGKNEVDADTVESFRRYLSKRELVKAHVLKTSTQKPDELAEEIAKQLGAEVVQVIGRKFILYLPNEELRKKGEAILLP